MVSGTKGHRFESCSAHPRFRSIHVALVLSLIQLEPPAHAVGLRAKIAPWIKREAERGKRLFSHAGAKVAQLDGAKQGLLVLPLLFPVASSLAPESLQLPLAVTGLGVSAVTVGLMLAGKRELHKRILAELEREVAETATGPIDSTYEHFVEQAIDALARKDLTMAADRFAQANMRRIELSVSGVQIRRSKQELILRDSIPPAHLNERLRSHMRPQLTAMMGDALWSLLSYARHKPKMRSLIREQLLQITLRIIANHRRERNRLPVTLGEHELQAYEKRFDALWNRYLKRSLDMNSFALEWLALTEKVADQV